MTRLNFTFHPSRPNLIDDRVAYFQEYGAALAAAKRTASDEPDEDAEEALPPFTVTEPATEIAVSDLGIGAKKVFLAAAALGWEPQAWRSRTHHEAVLHMTTTEKHNAGSVRYGEKDKRHYFMAARSPKARLGFTATWTGEGADLKTASFVDAIVYDPIGIPLELVANYSPSKYRRETLGKERSVREANDMDWEYNDGAELLVHRKYLKATAELNLWLDDWLGQLAPEYKRLSAKAKAPAPEFPDFGPSMQEQVESER